MRSWQRAAVLDEYDEDGEGVVLLPDGRVLALTALAWAAVESLAGGERTEAEVARTLADRFGVPTDDEGRDLTSDLTARTLEELADQCVVTPVAEA